MKDSARTGAGRAMPGKSSGGRDRASNESATDSLADSAAESRGEASIAERIGNRRMNSLLQTSLPAKNRSMTDSLRTDQAHALPVDASGRSATASAGTVTDSRSGHDVASAAQRNDAKPSTLHSASADSGTAVALPDAVLETIASAGRPLDEPTRMQMQRRFRSHRVHSARSSSTRIHALTKHAKMSRRGDWSEREAEEIADRVVQGSYVADIDTKFGAGPDFSDVRIHDDERASRSAKAINANAYTYGQHIVFASGRYANGSPAGDRLLAHELAHTLQPASASTIHRDEAAAPQQFVATMSVSLEGLHFEFPRQSLSKGASRTQMMAAILRRLLGEQYRSGIEDEVLKEIDATNTRTTGHLQKSSVAGGGEQMQAVNINLAATLIVFAFLRKKNFTIAISDSQRDLLFNAYYAQEAWKSVRDSFPPWYTDWIFRREISQHGAQLAEFRRGFEINSKSKTPENEKMLEDATVAIENALTNSAWLVDRIREDTALATEIQKPTNDILLKKNREGCSVAYANLFNLKLSPDFKLEQAPETVNQQTAADFFRFARSQKKLSAKCWGDDDAGHQARVEILGRFSRFWLRTRSGSGDEKILMKPALANAPAWNATLTSEPMAIPPLYAAALETDHAFTMQLQWKHFTDAMVRYTYRFEFIKLPEPSTENPVPDMSQAAGKKPSFGNVANARLARARRYNATDIERVRQQLGGLAFGKAAQDLVEVNNALRTVGTVIKVVLDKAMEPSYVTRYVFPSAGAYIVRCRALPVLDGDEELVRLPSVAYLLIVAQDPDIMAVSQVKDTTRMQFDAMLRIAEIEALFKSPFPPENADGLRKEMEDLRAFTIEPQESLAKRKSDLDAQIALVKKRISLRDRILAIEALPAASQDQALLGKLKQELAAAGGTEGNQYDDKRQLSTLEDKLESATNTISMHEKRTKDERGARFTPKISFVSDLGHSLQLSIEMYDRGVSDGAYQVYMSDITTPDSGEALGTAPPGGPEPRLQAIKNGLKKLLEESSDYGRGRVAVQVDGKIHIISIQAGTGRMMVEAVESAAMVASLAAIVAAPFTEGASLYLLLPLGAIGAVPSAYRLYQRYDEKRLRLDMAAIMDVLNVVGGVLGLAQAATPLRAVRLGKVLMVMGMGADGAGILMMGAGIVVQLDALRSLPEHERAARMLEILGQAFLQIGIQAGGTVMHARYQSRRTAAAGAEPHKSGSLDEPGFHAPPKEKLVEGGGKSPSPGDRSMAGSPPGDGAPLPPKAPPASTSAPVFESAPKASPEHLFDKLSQGIDRSLPPPLPADAVKNPLKAGEYKRGLTTAQAAYTAYNEALLRSMGREVAIYHNPETGEYRVMVGSEVGVSSPEGFGWNALLHYHPNKENTLTFRLPAPQDFKGLVMRYFAEGGTVREFLEFDIPGVGRGRTEFGIDPGNKEPFYVRIHQPDGTSRMLRFANDGHYSAYWGDRTIAVPKDSPVYDAMIRDIEAYLRSIGADRRSEFGPRDQGKTSPGTVGAGNNNGQHSGNAPGAPSPQAKTTAGAGKTTSVLQALQTGMGELTDAGVQFIRDRFQTTTESGGKKKIAVSSLSDAEIRSKFPNQPNWLEALVLAEARADWLSRSTDTDFAMSNPKQDFNAVAKQLAKAASKGKTGHSVFDSILEWSVKDFVEERMRQGDAELTAAYDLCENHPDPAVRRRWQEFKTSQKQGDMSGFFLGKVGTKRPDLVEVMLSKDTVHVTDISFAYQDPVHNFKTAFYKAVIQHLINVKTVTATDYRAPLKANPL
jgi:Domain of unknown function (DUF4157)